MGVLAGKKIIVTGGSLGIGLALAKSCAKEGSRLILISRHTAELENALKLIGGESQGHRFYCLDVSDREKVKVFAQTVEKELGYIDGLVNCAGVYGPIGKTSEIDPVELAKTIEINLLGTFYMCHYFIPLLKKSNRGKIVNFSGGGASGPFPNYSAYAISKTGVVRLTENLAMELLDDGIDVNAVAPGFVITRLHQATIKAGEKSSNDFLLKTLAQIDKGGVSPEISASLTVFLLSSDSDGITGKFISANWDPWADQAFQNKLRQEKDLATLRRIDDKTFFEKKE